MHIIDRFIATGAALLVAVIGGPASAAEPLGYNLVGTWQCHNPVIVQDHDTIAKDVDYQLVVFEQVHRTFLGYYEVDITDFDLGSGGVQAMEDFASRTDGITTRTTDDGLTFLHVKLTGVIGPRPDQFYAIDHLPDAFKIGVIDSSEHLSYVVVGFGQKAAAHNGYCIRTSREQPER